MMDAPGTTAPLGSMTWPRRVPADCAPASEVKARMKVNIRACLTNMRQIRGKRFFIGGTHPWLFTALDDPTVYFARKQVRVACLLRLPEEADSLVFVAGHFCPRPNSESARDDKYASRPAAVPEFQ